MAMVEVTLDIDTPRFGPSYANPQGGFAALGARTYGHRFGGSSWRVTDPSEIHGGPTLLFVLDLRDPVLSGFRVGGLIELPVCSYAVCDVWAFPQLYRIQPDDKSLTLIGRHGPGSEEVFPELLGPFPEKNIHFEPLRTEDYPTTEELYWRASDDFLGRSPRFFRVAGTPLWVFAAMTVRCPCGRQMKYVCSLGYEGESSRLGLVANELLFLGESALYWFLCPCCLNLAVVSQAT